MKKPYSDIVTRLLLQPRQLERIFPTEPIEIEQVLRIRETDDMSIQGQGDLLQPEHFPILRAGLFYFYDALDEAMQTLPDIADPTTAYWRSMVFRRLGDVESAKRSVEMVGQHPVYDHLHARVSEGSPNMAKQLSWDPYLFINMAEQHRFGDDDSVKELIFLQQTEFEVLYDYTWRQVIEVTDERE